MKVPEHVAKMFAIFSAAYPNWQVTADTIRVWSEFLSDEKPSALVMAAAHFARTSKFPPSIAEVRRLIHASEKVSAEEAWEKVKLGEPPPNENARRALEAIGNPFARGTHSGPRALASEMGTLRAHFRDAYNAFEEKREWYEEEESIETLESFNRADLLEMDRQEMRELNGHEEEPESDE